MTTKVTLAWHGGNRFVGWGGSGVPVLINFAADQTPATSPPAGPPPGGSGPTPTELLLIATGACTGLDVVSLLEKQRVTFSGLEIEVSGERAAEHPRYFTNVEVVYRLKASPQALPQLQRAAELSMEKYCSVGQSLKAAKSWRCEIAEGEGSGA